MTTTLHKNPLFKHSKPQLFKNQTSLNPSFPFQSSNMYILWWMVMVFLYNIYIFYSYKVTIFIFYALYFLIVIIVAVSHHILTAVYIYICMYVLLEPYIKLHLHIKRVYNYIYHKENWFHTYRIYHTYSY